MCIGYITLKSEDIMVSDDCDGAVDIGIPKLLVQRWYEYSVHVVNLLPSHDLLSEVTECFLVYRFCQVISKLGIRLNLSDDNLTSGDVVSEVV